MTGDTFNPTVYLRVGEIDSSRFGLIGKQRPANYGACIRHAEYRQRQAEGSNSVMSEVTGP